MMDEIIEALLLASPSDLPAIRKYIAWVKYRRMIHNGFYSPPHWVKPVNKYHWVGRRLWPRSQAKRNMSNYLMVAMSKNQLRTGWGKSKQTRVRRFWLVWVWRSWSPWLVGAPRMIDTLREHRSTLEKFQAATVQYIPSEPLPVGLQLTIGIYITILTDAISVLNSLIDFLGNATNGNTDI